MVNLSFLLVSPIELIRLQRLKDKDPNVDLEMDQDLAPHVTATDMELARAIELSKFQQILE